MRAAAEAPIRAVRGTAFRIPTEGPESDGTLAWDTTTLVLVRVQAGGHEGIGYSYADRAAAVLVNDTLAPELEGRDGLKTAARWADMVARVRNLGHRGIAAMAISAVDAALWDLKGKLLQLPLMHLLGGAARDAIPVYGSGGFTSYDVAELESQLAGWAEQGMTRVKMKVGREPAQDAARVAAARHAVGDRVELFVDANGAYGRKQALAMANRFAQQHVVWFEEPVPSDDVAGLRLLRDRGPAGMDISAGEYGWELLHFRGLLEAGAVDVLQADATRCGGLTGFMRVAGLAQAFGVPLSSHCAPSLHVAACCCAGNAVHLEWFHDHQRIERMVFDGAPQPKDGMLAPDLQRPGIGLAFRDADAAEYAL
ncbi:enolase C-terminal domain-like protein [Variovorax soli]|uniref:L-alanine-DL-glutamate epimerase-like enolase superfamily enzyme n=1 Tax=Variovorax soli TaxID=376815 RepID=A0ABU1NES2_9BURK|nr:enolase C-terminal domain-like protein [Variovorax soli]MDR6536535.1 L-alanine-DL-glutamate epimerase-like enolase superfamily enzyme [Variovorax soli]